jgi:hypothetical protein
LVLKTKIFLIPVQGVVRDLVDEMSNPIRMTKEFKNYNLGNDSNEISSNGIMQVSFIPRELLLIQYDYKHKGAIARAAKGFVLLIF